MLKDKDILDEKCKILHQVSKEVTFPMSDDDKKMIEEMIEHLTLSQIPEKSEELNLRPGMGMAAVQVGILKRYFVVVYEYEDQKFENYILVNPKIVSESNEMIYVEEGEGCLSVNRPTEGIVPRRARITMEGFDQEGNPVRYRVREDLAVAFQHEYDHLNGIIFTDKIDPKNPFKNKDKYRAI